MTDKVINPYYQIECNNNLKMDGNEYLCGKLLLDFNTLTREVDVEERTGKEVPEKDKIAIYSISSSVDNKNTKLATTTITLPLTKSSGDLILLDPTIIITNITFGASYDNVTPESNFSHLSINDEPPFNNLIAYWNFDDNASSTMVYDFSNNNWDATASTYIGDGNEIRAGGPFGNYFYNNGIDNNNPLDIGHDNDVITEITQALWFYLDADVSMSPTLLAYGWARVAAFSNTKGMILCDYYNGSTRPYKLSDNPVNDSKWHHIVCRYNGTDVDMWIDGVKQITYDPVAKLTGTLLASTYSELGSGGYGGSSEAYPHNGGIDEVMMFNTSLTKQQILDIYNNQSNRFKQKGKHGLNITLDGEGYNYFVVTGEHRNYGKSNVSLSIGYYFSNEWIYMPPVNYTGYNIIRVNNSQFKNASLNFTFYAGDRTDEYCYNNTGLTACTNVTTDTACDDVSGCSWTGYCGGTLVYNCNDILDSYTCYTYTTLKCSWDGDSCEDVGGGLTGCVDLTDSTICDYFSPCEWLYNCQGAMTGECGQIASLDDCEGATSGLCDWKYNTFYSSLLLSGTGLTMSYTLNYTFDTCGFIDRPGEYSLLSSINDNTLTSDCIVIISDNVTFDCQGKSITSTTNYAAIYSANTRNITIKGCKLDMGTSGYGIELSSVNYAYLFNNTFAVQNSGVHLSNVQNTSITYNLFNGSAFGIYTASAFKTSNVTNNQFKSGTSGIYQANIGNTVLGTEINHNIFNATQYGYFCYSGNNNLIFRNNTFIHSWYAIRSASKDYLIYNTTIYNCSGTSNLGCVYILSNNNTFIRGIWNISKSWGMVYIGTGDNNEFRDIEMYNIGKSGVYLTSTTVNNTFVNVSYENETVASGSHLIRKWYFKAYVNDSDNKILSDANVSLFNVSNNFIANLTASATGYTDIYEIVDYYNIGGVKNYQSNYLINGTYTGYNPNISYYNVTLNQNNLNYIITLTNTTYTTSPSVRFMNYAPNLSTTILFYNNLSIDYNITDYDLNTSKIFLYYKLNSTTEDILEYVNGSALYVNFTRINGTNSSFNWTFKLTENEVYPYTSNLNLSIFFRTQHVNHKLSIKKDYIKIRFFNVSNSRRYNLFEIDAFNTTSDLSALSIFYCNSSYTSGNPRDSTDCFDFYNILSTTPFNHTHSQYSSHHIAPFYVNTTSGMIGNVYVTPTSYFLLHPLANTPWNVSYIPNISRIDTIQTSTNNGNAWSNLAGTVDSHIHQYNGTEKLNFYVCANDTRNNENCSDLYTAYIDLVNLTPSSVQIYSPTNQTYSGNIHINYSQAYSLQDISYYNISLLYSNLTYVSLINEDNGLNLEYNWNTILTPNGNYVVQVIAYDINGFKSYGFSDNFTVYNPVSIVPSSSSAVIGASGGGCWPLAKGYNTCYFISEGMECHLGCPEGYVCNKAYDFSSINAETLDYCIIDLYYGTEKCEQKVLLKERLKDTCAIDNGVCEDGEYPYRNKDCDIVPSAIICDNNRCIFKEMWFAKLVILLLFLLFLFYKKDYIIFIIISIFLLFVNFSENSEPLKGLVPSSISQFNIQNVIGYGFMAKYGAKVMPSYPITGFFILVLFLYFIFIYGKRMIKNKLNKGQNKKWRK